MDAGRGKRAVIVLSSEEDDEVDDEYEEDSFDGDHDYTDRDGSSESDDTGDDRNHDAHDDESLSNKVLALLREGNDIESLKLRECKAYLRKHGLRIAGTRAVCIARIKEHWGLKDGNGYNLYPRSSFIINCTGDVCKGDVVSFRQKVYEKFDKKTRNGRVIGSRTVAGRVVKESYGAAKQQHTFTVEVLWSNGVRKLPPLFPLLIKGRNLYKLKTYRQRWKNEADRVKVLSEKHRRGAAARSVRAMRQKKKECYANVSKGTKRQHETQNTKPSKKRRSFEQDKVRNVDGRRRAQEAASSTHATRKENATSRVTRGWHTSAEFGNYQVPVHPYYADYQHRSYPFQNNSQNRNVPSIGYIPYITGFPFSGLT
ncbi:hypothetical protein PIB30_002385 [Stylosanthes scabra]|uniref:SAP domain-containing protein n=1 Tax=Stylosanthes scabra TaxID=79078 RepID=A0ABU6V2R7_9FABA|nr:hypothetical protein [Stylosanthes scabra]